MGRRSLLTAAAVAVAGLATTAGAGSSARTRITVWAAPSASGAYGGLGYGGYAPTTGAMITEQREVEVTATGEVRIAGVAATVDPGSVQLRDLSDASATVAQQRFLPGAITPTEILGRHVGDPRRLPDRLEVVSEEQLRTSPGRARIRIAPASDITGVRLATCTYDERGKTITEKVTVTIENKSKQAADVVVREFLWRWPVWRLEAEAPRGNRTGTQTQEYRLDLPAGGKRSVTYAVHYTTW